MNREWKFVFLKLFIFFLYIGEIVNDIPVDEKPKTESAITARTQEFSIPRFGEIVLPCHVENEKNNESVIWTFNRIFTLYTNFEKLHNYEGDHFSVTRDHALLIKNFTFEFEGTYSCEISKTGILGLLANYTVTLKEEISETIVLQSEKEIFYPLPCHPAHQISNLDKNDFEWVTNNDIPVFLDGQLTPYFKLNPFEQRYDIGPDGSLIIFRILPGNFTFTCRNHRLYTKYTHVIFAKQFAGFRKIERLIRFKRVNEPISLPCGEDEESVIGSSYSWMIRRNQESLEVISLNRTILLANNPAGFRIEKDGSLTIPKFRPTFLTSYECSLEKGPIFSYFTTTDENVEIQLEDWVTVAAKNISVELGNNVSLNCPTDNLDYDFVWRRNEYEMLAIGGYIIRSRNTSNLEINPKDRRSLVIKNFSHPSIGEYECLLRNGSKYLYNISISIQTEPPLAPDSHRDGLTCPDKKDVFLHCPSNATDVPFVWIRKDDVGSWKILFINGRPVSVGENSRFKIAADKRSLWLKNFDYNLGGYYVCLFSTGMKHTYYTVPLKPAKKPEIKHRRVTFTGYNQIRLDCPQKSTAIAFNSFTWSFKSTNHPEILLFANATNFAKRVPEKYNIIYELDPERKNFEIMTMIISTNPTDSNVWGVYTCRWATGETFIYNYTNGIEWKNESVSVNEGDTVTLPCNLTFTGDKEIDLVEWYLNLPNTDYMGEFRFIYGKMIPPPPRYQSALPDFVKLGDDLQSLEISNITADLEGDYICNQMHGKKSFKYSIELEVEWKNQSIILKEGDTVILPCKLTFHKDKEINLVEWHLDLPKVNYTRKIRYSNGDLVPTSSCYPPKIPHVFKTELDDDKQSLKISSITPALEGDYICNQIHGKKSFKYSLIVKGS